MADGFDLSPQTTDPSNIDILTSVDVAFEGADSSIVSDISWTQVVLAESILTPGLQTSIKLNNNSNFLNGKNFDSVKGIPLYLKMTRPSVGEMQLRQTIYRLGGRSATKPLEQDNRKLINRAVEELTFHACDPTLLNDAANLVSKSWKCTTPSQITAEVLAGCADARNLYIEPSDPARDFIAENKHPFQVVQQQANAALAAGNDPSFLHFMTYEGAENGYGRHHFRSLYSMTKQASIANLIYAEQNAYNNPYSIMSYYFPCDFDLLSDILNSVGSNGADIGSLAGFNFASGAFSLFGNQALGCGIGGGSYKIAGSNMGTEMFEYSCPDYTSTYLLKRQARMGMLEKDKIALRITVPWNPIYNVGKMITVSLYNPQDTTQTQLKYGSGDYLIVALVHNIVAGGYSTITLDCVSRTVGQGQV